MATNAAEALEIDESPPITQSEPLSEEAKDSSPGGRTNPLGVLIAGALIINGFINDPKRFSEKRLEQEAEKYARKVVGKNNERNTVRQLGGAYISTYDEAKQEYYNNFVKAYRNTAKIFKKNPRELLSRSLQKALAIDDIRRENFASIKAPQVNELSGMGKPNELSGMGKPNELAGMGKPNELSGMGKPNEFTTSREAEREKRQENQRNRRQIPDRLLRRIINEQRGTTNITKQPGIARRVIQRPVTKFTRSTTQFTRSAAQTTGRAASRMGQQLGRQAARIGAQIGKAGAQIGSKLAASLAANPYFWLAVGIVIVIIAVVVLFLVIISVITGQNNSSSQPGQTLTCPTGDYASCLKRDFNVIVSGARGDDLSRIYQSFAFAGQSKQYVDLLTKGGQQLIITMNYDSGGCGGDTHGFAGTILISARLCPTLSLATFRYLLIHESGHVLNARNRPLFYSYPWTDYKSQSPDSSCYDEGFIKSYALRSGVDAKDESFSESIADSLRPLSNSGVIPPAQTINNFATECPATYNWFKNNVFGGFTFF